MANCPNLAVSEIAKQFEELKDIFGERMAYFLWDKNGGFALELNKEGKPSILFDAILKHKDVKGNRVKALKIKSQIYLKGSESAEGLEPSVNEINFPKSLLTDNKTNLYSSNLISQEAYDELPYKETMGVVKTELFRDKSVADSVANKYGGRVYDVNTRGGLLYKVVISNPMSSSNYLPMDEVKLPKEAQEVVLRMQNRIKAFERKLSQKSPRAAEIKASISALKSKIKKITDEYDTDMLRKIAYNDTITIENNLKDVSERLKDENLTDSDLRNLMEVLLENNYNIRGWIDASDLINSDLTEFKGSIDHIQGKISRLSNSYRDLTADIYLRYINQKTYRSDFTRDDILGAVEDISAYKANVLNIGETNIPLVQTADDLIKTIANTVNEKYIERTSEINNWLKKLKAHAGKNEREVSDMFLQYNDKGEWTGNFIGRYSQEFFNKRRSLAEVAKKEDNWKPYFKWLKENSTDITNAQLLKVNKLTIEEINKLSEDKALGVFSREEVLKQKKLLDRYSQDKQAQIELMSMSGEYHGGSLIEENGVIKFTHPIKEIENDFYLNLKGWEDINSPYVFSASKDKKGKDGSSYIINPRPKDQWLDKRYSDIQKDEVLYDFYKYMKSTFKENNEYMPYFNGLQDNYLPELEASLLDRIKESPSIAAKYSLLANDLKISLTDNADSNGHSSININGKEVRSISVHMMEDKLLTENKESNIFTVLKEHSKQSFNYRYKAEIEPIVNAAVDLLDNVKEKTVDKFGTTVEIPGKLVHAKAALQYAIDANIYGKSQDVEGKTGVKLKTKSKSGEEEEREFTLSKIVDLVNGFTYKKQMSFPNFITSTVNATFGVISNMSYAAANEDVLEKEMIKAHIQMASITSETLGAKINKDLALKTYAFMSRLRVIGDIHDGNNKKKSFGEILTIMQSKAEFFNQGSLMLAMLRSQKLKDKNGNEVTVFDAYNEKDGTLVWNTELMGDEQKVPSNRIYSEDFNQVNLNSLSFYMEEVNSKVHGDYKNTIMIKKKAGWRLVMLYKRWLPQAIEHRFSEYKVNPHLLGKGGVRGRATKGRYRSIFDMTTQDGVRVKALKTMELMLKGMITKKSFKDLSDIDRVNMIRNMRELQFIGMIYGTVMMLQALFGDDDDDNWALKMAINTLSKTQSDMMFFLNPNSANQVLNNAIPAMSTIGDFIRIFGAIEKTVLGEPYYENGPWKDKSRIGVATMRAVPITSGGVKLYNYGSRIFDYN